VERGNFCLQYKKIIVKWKTKRFKWVPKIVHCLRGYFYKRAYKKQCQVSNNNWKFVQLAIWNLEPLISGQTSCCDSHCRPQSIWHSIAPTIRTLYKAFAREPRRTRRWWISSSCNTREMCNDEAMPAVVGLWWYARESGPSNRLVKIDNANGAAEIGH